MRNHSYYETVIDKIAYSNNGFNYMFKLYEMEQYLLCGVCNEKDTKPKGTVCIDFNMGRNLIKYLILVG